MTKNDLDLFWKQDADAKRDNCFYAEAKQVAMGIMMSDECVFAELGEGGDPWGHTPRERRIELNKRYNDKAEKIVGRRLLNEYAGSAPAADSYFPHIKRIGEVFGGHYAYGTGTGEWLYPGASTPAELEALLDRIDAMNLRDFIYPDNWEAEKQRIFEKYGARPHQNRWVRGPVTLAMSIYGEENLIYLYYDEPQLFERFSNTIRKVLLEIIRLADVEAGYPTVAEAPHGFGFADDNCALMTRDMYEVFGYPILKAVFDTYCPSEGNWRYQHSDSAMGHLLPVLGKLRFSGVNFGPTVMADEIRRYMPSARIDGCIHPITFMNNDTTELRRQVKRDCENIKSTGTKGLHLATAGSINNGSLLTSMLAVMEAVVEFGQY